MKTLLIKNTVSSETAHQRILDGIQGRATTRILTFKFLLELATEAEALLAKKGLPNVVCVGTEYDLSATIPFKAYRYPSDSTVVCLVRRQRGWAIKSIERVTNWPVSGGLARGRELTLPESAMEYMLSKSIYHCLVARMVARAFHAGAESVRQEMITHAAIPAVQPAAVPEVKLAPASSPMMGPVPAPTLLPAPEAFSAGVVPSIPSTPETVISFGGPTS